MRPRKRKPPRATTSIRRAADCAPPSLDRSPSSLCKRRGTRFVAGERKWRPEKRSPDTEELATSHQGDDRHRGINACRLAHPWADHVTAANCSVRRSCARPAEQVLSGPMTGRSRRPARSCDPRHRRRGPPGTSQRLGSRPSRPLTALADRYARRGPFFPPPGQVLRPSAPASRASWCLSAARPPALTTADGLAGRSWDIVKSCGLAVAVA
jgi:hypothetical protein